jgi:hypothetical protein
MKLLYVIAAIVLWQIAGWAFTPAPPPKQLPNSDRAYGSDEKYLVEGREKQRQSAFRALARPTGSLCIEESRKEFISGLGEYYYHRQNQMERYPENFGKLGADYIAKQWASTDDKRIDRLTQEAYSKGYLKPDEFQAVARKMIQTVVKGERVVAKGCA